MKILVTGGAGFIGSHLVKALVENNYEVLVIDNLSTGKREYLPESIEFYQRDITEKNAFEGIEGVDTIIHLAAQVDARASVEDPLFDAQNNIIGTIACLEYARKTAVKKFVFASTCGVYGDQTDLPIAESASTDPISAYGLSKLCAEQYIQYYHRIYNLDTAILRFANIYGPRQYRSENSGVISLFAHLVQENKPFTIFGDGKQTRDYLYVADVVSAIIATLSTRIASPINIGTSMQSHLLEVIDLMKKQAQIPIEIRFEEEKKGDIKYSCLDIKQAKDQLNWSPHYDLESGIRLLFS